MTTTVRGMSLRQLAKVLGVSQPFLSQIRAGKRPLPESLKSKLEALGAYHLLIGDKQTELEIVGSLLHARWLNSGAGDGNRTHDSLLGKQVLYL